MYDIGVTCSYGEVQRFKQSVAKEAIVDKDLRGKPESKIILMQTLVLPMGSL